MVEFALSCAACYLCPVAARLGYLGSPGAREGGLSGARFQRRGEDGGRESRGASSTERRIVFLFLFCLVGVVFALFLVFSGPL